MKLQEFTHNLFGHRKQAFGADLLQSLHHPILTIPFITVVVNRGSLDAADDSIDILKLHGSDTNLFVKTAARLGALPLHRLMEVVTGTVVGDLEDVANEPFHLLERRRLDIRVQVVNVYGPVGRISLVARLVTNNLDGEDDGNGWPRSIHFSISNPSFRDKRRAI